jgi:hypothetical protein
MNENKDSHQIVLSREYFDQLVKLAKRSDRPAGRVNHPNQTIVDRVLWHVRKYNVAYKEEQAVQRLASEKELRELRKRVKHLVKNYVGKEVYVKSIGENAFEPAIVVGASYDKFKVKVRLYKFNGAFRSYTQDMNIRCIQIENPNQLKGK